MRKLATLRPMRLVVIVGLCLTLWGCGLVNPRPPRAVVESAIAQKLSQTQAILYRQLAPTTPDQLAQVGRIRITDHHWMTLAGQPTADVVGTYHLKGGELSRAQKRQTRDFEVYLQRGEVKGQWRLLEPAIAAGETTVQWRAIPLTSASNTKSADLES